MVHVKQLSKENERIAVPGEPHSRKRLQKVEYLNMIPSQKVSTRLICSPTIWKY